jgi:hypothetical protein
VPDGEADLASERAVVVSPASTAPVVQVTARADAHRAREWWAKWTALTPVEPRRPAAEILAEAREADDT